MNTDPFEQFIGELLLYSLSNGGNTMMLDERIFSNPDNEDNSYEPDVDYTKMSINEFIKHSSDTLRLYCKNEHIEYKNEIDKVKKEYSDIDDIENELSQYHTKLWSFSPIRDIFPIFNVFDDMECEDEFMERFLKLFNENNFV